jgi:uncharacterized membrane protein
VPVAPVEEDEPGGMLEVRRRRHVGSTAPGVRERPETWPAGGLRLPGVWGALLLAWLSFTPSLLPRGPVTQGIVGGISGAIGYGLGVLAASVWRAFADRDPRPAGASAWRWTAVAAVVGTTVAVIVGRVTQGRVLELMGGAPGPAWLILLTPVLLVGVLAVLLAAARWVRRTTRRLTALLGRHVGPRAARTLGWMLVTAASVLVVTGLLLDGFIAVADRAFSARDTSTAEGVEPPTSSFRSGGPGSLIEWDTLGRQGRTFVAAGPTADEVQGFTGVASPEPVRVYAGLASESDVELRARRAVDDLERAGGFDRANLLVATTTGTGWLEPGTMASFEYVAGGDSAIVSMQYSYLPSWLSYLVDQPRARQAGRELFDAVYERWSARPTETRPRLYVFGESLGSFGAEAAFSGEFDLRNRTDGALFVGPPGFNVLHREFTGSRDPGSTQILPVLRDGRTVRFAGGPTPARSLGDGPWEGTRVLYLQHASDPIVWWDTRLLLRRPDWLREPRGPDVLDEVVWVPFVTFWQVTGDMPFAVEVPDGYGHRYSSASVDAWATILQPPGWDEGRADVLRELIAPD